MKEEKLTEQRDGQNVIALRQDGKRIWAIASAGMGEKSTRFLYGEYADKLAEYEEIGTPEECREAIEKQKAKKPLNVTVAKDGNKIVGTVGRCPSCGEIIDDTTLVCDCGQKMDW